MLISALRIKCWRILLKKSYKRWREAWVGGLRQTKASLEWKESLSDCRPQPISLSVSAQTDEWQRDPKELERAGRKETPLGFWQDERLPKKQGMQLESQANSTCIPRNGIEYTDKAPKKVTCQVPQASGTAGKGRSKLVTWLYEWQPGKWKNLSNPKHHGWLQPGGFVHWDRHILASFASDPNAGHACHLAGVSWAAQDWQWARIDIADLGSVGRRSPGKLSFHRAWEASSEWVYWTVQPNV